MSETKLIAFYLPQFYPTEYNDKWWGKGFTEWTFVTKAKPQFPEHLQPRLPADLGFYDLRTIDTRLEQIKLAKKYNIYGFCYYFYWFNGKRLLERPLDDLLIHKELDHNFCICWANENWSRRWDGSEDQLLMEQIYTPENDEKIFTDMLPFISDERYIKIHGSPLLIVYRVDQMPYPRETFKKWRSLAQENGIENLHISAIESFGIAEPRQYGCDSSIEFPPHGLDIGLCTEKYIENEDEFNGKIYDYEEVVSYALNKEMPSYKHFRGIMTNWDNTPRRGKNSHIFVNSSPEIYETWLRGLVKITKNCNENGEQLIFINAWNEWAEGAYLEPDQLYGKAYLEATRNAVTKSISKESLLNELDEYQWHDEKIKKLFKHDLVILLESYERSLGFAARLVRDSERPLFNKGSPIITELPLFVPVKSYRNIKKGGQIKLDQLNQFNVGNSAEFYISRKYSLFIRGWSFHKNVTSINKHLLIIVLKDLVTDKAYFSIVNNGREHRPDVDEHFKLKYKENDLSMNGIACTIDITGLEPSKYLLGVINYNQKTAFICFDPTVIYLV